MPTVYRNPRSRFLWCKGRDVDGNLWRESTKQTDEGLAERAAREIERRYIVDAGWKKAARHEERIAVELALSVSLDRVLQFQRESKRSKKTIRATTYHARHLIEHLGAKTPLGSITLNDTTNYMRKRLDESAHRHTIAKEIKTLTQAMRRAEKLGLFKAPYSASHYFPDELKGFYKPRDRWMTREEYEALLAAMTPKPPPKRNQRVPKTSRRRVERQDRRDYITCYCHLGVRKAELFDVLPVDYDASQRKLRVRGTKTDGADRMISVNDDAHAVLVRRCDVSQYTAAGLARLRELVEKKNDPTRPEGLSKEEASELRRLPKPFPEWSDGSCTRDLAKACVRAGIDPVTPNDLRRTFCSWLCQAGISERMCADLMGHESTTMVRAVYGHLDQASMAKAVAKIASKSNSDIPGTDRYATN